MKRFVQGKRLMIFLIISMFANIQMMFGQSDCFDVWDSQFKTNIDERIKVEISKTVETNKYGRKELVITDVRLKVLKGFELADVLRRGGSAAGAIYDLSQFSLVEDDGIWLVYRPDKFSWFEDVYSIDWNTGETAIRDVFFYAKDVKIAPVKDSEELHNIFNYYEKGSVTLQDGEILISKHVSIPDPIQFVKGGSPIVVHQEKIGGPNRIWFEVPEINIDGGDISFIGEEKPSISSLNLSAGSLRLSGISVNSLEMKSGNLNLDGENTSLSSLLISGGSIHYEDLGIASKAYIGNLNIEGDISIIGNGNMGYLAETAQVKNAVVDVQNNVTDTSCGAKKANPFVKDEITIDGSSLSFKNTDLSNIKGITITGTSNVEMSNISFHREGGHGNKPIYLKGGTLSIDGSYLDGRLSGAFYEGYLIEQEDGFLRIKSSYMGTPILLKGTNAKAEVLSGVFDVHDKAIVIEAGSLDVKGGQYAGTILMKGGSLDMSGGVFSAPSSSIEVLADCDISLSGGYFPYSYDIAFGEGVTVPSSSSLLVDGYMFGDDYINMIYPLGQELVAQKTGLKVDGVYQTGMVYQFGMVVPKATMKETVAYEVAKKADVGPNGKDVKVKEATYEIFTPQGLVWLAVITNDHFSRFKNGKEYFPHFSNIPKTYKLMGDLDMTGYGEDWPSIGVYEDILDGQGYRVYNLNATGPTPSFIDGISRTGVVANLLVEGNIRMNRQKYIISNLIHEAGGLARCNEGRIVNCAFIGTVSGEVVPASSIGGLVGYNAETGSIENCYVNPCDGLIGGIRPADISLEGLYPCVPETYSVAKLVGSNRGSITNCYFAGEIDFDNQVDNPNVNVTLHPDFVGDWNGDYGTVTNCYDGPDVSLQTLNANVQKHQQEEGYPWATWAVDPDKQCGKPYLVIDTHIPPTDKVVIIDGDQPYDKTHAKANVTVKSGAIYTINELGASIASLVVEDGGQVRVRKSFNVMDSVVIERYIETDKWTTFCTPIDMRVLNNDRINGTYGDEPLWSKVGYVSSVEQDWKDYAAVNAIHDIAHIFVAQEISQMGRFKSETAPLILEAVIEPVAPGNVPNGSWFHFVSNPYWENLPVNGRAYVLNEAGTSFELQENPVIPPFHCYMIASEAVMNKISSLRLGGIPTSVEGILETGFRAWTENRTLCFETSEARDIVIYSLAGVPQARYDRSVGVKRLSLPQGVYLVVCEGTAVKIIL